MKLEKHISHLEEQVLNLQKEIYELRNTYENEISSTDEKIDISMIEQYARQTAFNGHGCCKLSPFLLKRYCTLLAGAAVHLRDKEKKVRQYYFISRIFYSCGQGEFLDEVVRDAQLVSLDDMEQFKADSSQDLHKLFLTDLLLMISLDGEMDDRQLEYFCEMYSFFFPGEKELSIIANAVNTILTKDDQTIGDWITQIPVTLIQCYLQNMNGDISVITDFSSITSMQESCIIVCNAKINGQSNSLDAFGKKCIRFINCHFSQISRMHAGQTRIVFENCRFEDCTGEVTDGKHFGAFYFHEAIIRNCTFINCRMENNEKASVFLQMSNGSITNTCFENCNVEAKPYNRDGNNNLSFAFGAVLYIKKVDIQACIFKNCYAKSGECKHSVSGGVMYSVSSADKQRVHIINCTAGTIKNCTFIQCQAIPGRRGLMLPLLLINSTEEGTNYLINNQTGTETNNQFKDCKAEKMVGSIEWEI